MVLICLSNRLLTSPDSLWKRVISGADVLIVDQPLWYFVTLCYYLSLPVLTTKTVTTEIAAVTMADLKTVYVTPYHASVDECSESPQSDIRCTEATGSMPHAAPLIDRRVSVGAH